jgi:hypothetical protein
MIASRSARSFKSNNCHIVTNAKKRHHQEENMTSNVLSPIYRTMSLALSLDDGRKHKEAYHKYLDVVESTVTLLRTIEREQVIIPVDQLSQLVKLNTECLQRVEHIACQRQQRETVTSPSSATLTTSPSPTFNTSSLENNNNMKPRTFQAFELYYSQKIINEQKKQQTTRIQKKSTLADVRKMAEDKALLQIKQQMEYQKQLAVRQQSIQLIEKTVHNNSKRFKWTSQDKYTKFLDQYFNYMSMEADLLHEDSKWLTMLQDQINYAKLNESDPNAPSIEGTLTTAIKQHFKLVVRLPGHAISLLLSNFASNFIQTYSQNFSDVSDESQRTELVREMITRATTDINTFIEKTVQALFGKYWTGFTSICEKVPECEKVVVYCINEQLLSTTDIYTHIERMYHIIHRHNDELLNQKLDSLSTARLAHFHVRTKFRLGDDESNSDPYRAAVEKLIEFDTQNVLASDKLQNLVCCFREINLCVIRYWDQSSDPKPSNLDLGADDLLPLFCYVLARAKPMNLHSKINYMSDFADDSLLLGELGYSLATLETAAHYITTLDLEVFFDYANNDITRSESPTLTSTTSSSRSISPSPTYNDAYDVEQQLYTVTTQPDFIIVDSISRLRVDNHSNSKASPIELPDELMSQSLTEDDFADLFF